jgi:hypothetical protein
MQDQHYISGDRYPVGHSMPRLMQCSRRRQRAVLQFLVTHAVLPLTVLWDLLKRAANLLPDTWDRLVFGRFWGQGILSADVLFVMDSYEDVRLRSGFRWAEAQSRQDPPDQLCSSEIIHGTFSPQAAAMLTELFLRHTGRVPRIATDTEIYHKRDATMICYGTSDSNFKTFDIEASSESELCQFSFNGNGERAFRLAGQIHSIERRGSVTYDKAILLRLVSRQHSQHCHVICAGLSEWGSLAAVSYLTKNWKVLHKRFDRFGHRRDFCVLLEVPCGQSEKVREVASAVWWEPKTVRQPDGALPTRR